MNKLIFILCLIVTINVAANDSIYTPTKTFKCKVIEEDEKSVELNCPAPSGFTFKIIDTGGVFMQFIVEKGSESLAFHSTDVPDLIEWRVDGKNNILGVIVRVYEYSNIEEPSGTNVTSLLHVVDLKKTPRFLGKVKTNQKARMLIDRQ